MLTTARKSLRLLGPTRRRRFMWVALLSVVVSGFEAVSALLVFLVLQFILEPGTVPDLPVLGDVSRFLPTLTYEQLVIYASGAFALFFVVGAVLFLFQQYALAKVAENTGVLLSDRLVEGYLSMPYAFHLQRNSSELIRNAYDNVQQVVGGVFAPMATFVAEVSMTLAMLSVLLIASARATAVASAVIVMVVFLTLRVIHPRLKSRGRQRQVAARSALQHLQQGFGGLRDIKILGKETAFSRSYRQVRTEMAEAQYSKAVLSYAPRVTMETTFLLLVLGALVLAVMQGAVGEILATLGTFAYAGLRLQPSLTKLAGAFNSLKYAEAAIDDLVHDLDLLDASRSERMHADRSNEPLRMSSNLELRDVHFRYAAAEEEALQGISLVIRKGESIGIAGSTGSGKTTLLDVICGLLDPTAGAVLVDGVDIRGSVRAWQRKLGVVHQDSFLIDDTLRANVALGVSQDEVDEALLQACIQLAQLSTFVASLPHGLATRVGERGVRLSGGQRQRITLARALYREPDVLILDEGTAAVDNETERALMDSIAELAGDVTVIMVAHRLTSIRDCDKVVYLEEGRVAAAGTFEELVSSHDGFRRMSSAGLGRRTKGHPSDAVELH